MRATTRPRPRDRHFDYFVYFELDANGTWCVVEMLLLVHHSTTIYTQWNNNGNSLPCLSFPQSTWTSRLDQLSAPKSHKSATQITRQTAESLGLEFGQSRTTQDAGPSFRRNSICRGYGRG